MSEKIKYQYWAEKPFVSGILVILNIIVFMICTFTGKLLYNSGKLDVWNVIVQGRYECIFLSLFLHADIQHLFNNMLILFFLGAMIEKEVGHFRYTILYFLSGVGGNLFSLYRKMITNDMVASIGASGAIFGLDGVLLAYVLFSEKKMENVTVKRVMLMIVYSLYSGFQGNNIDNNAHVGGLVTGFLFGSIFCKINQKRNT